MEALTKGEVVLFPFPYTDLSHRKIRPCLVISSEMGEDLILCQITSKFKKDSYCIELRKEETKNGSLLIDSYIRTNMIFTAVKSQVIKKLCEVSDQKYKEVVSAIIGIILKPSG